MGAFRGKHREHPPGLDETHDWRRVFVETGYDLEDPVEETDDHQCEACGALNEDPEAQRPCPARKAETVSDPTKPRRRAWSYWSARSGSGGTSNERPSEGGMPPPDESLDGLVDMDDRPVRRRRR